MKKILTLFTLLLMAASALVGCSNDDRLFEGKDNSLTSFSITAKGITYKAAVTDSEIIISAPVGTDLSGAEVQYQLSEHATITPDPKEITNWNSQYVFRVKSYSQTPREYTYSVLRTEVSQTGNVQLLTQTEVDDFAKMGVTVIDGNLIIGSDNKPVEDSIVSLEALRSLKEVRYNIMVNRSFAGSNLAGLENIETCGGLQVGTMTAPVEFPAQTGISIDLPVLKSAGDIVLNSSSIKSLLFPKLESVSSFFVSSNSLVALKTPLLKEIVGNFNLENNSASTNSILSEISFPQLESVGGKFSMQYFSGLTTVGFSKLNSVGGDINIALNSGTLEELAFPELSTVKGAVIVERAPGLLKFAMPKVKQITSFIYNKSSYGNYPLENLDLSALETIDQELYIRGVALETLTLPALSHIEGDATLWDLKIAASIKLPSIKKIGNKLQLYGTALLESLDISTLETLPQLELIGSLSLKTVKSPATLGNLTLNYASNAQCLTPVFEGLQQVEGTLYFTSDSKTELFDVKNIKQIGTLKFGGGAAGAKLNLYDTEKIGTFDLSSSNIVELNAPKLREVENLKFTYVSKLATIHIPLLKTVGTFSLSEHNQWSTSSARMTDLDAYSGITSIGSVSISYCNKLIDFSGLSGIISVIDATQWSVSNCAYNPTYQDMVEGHYVKP